MMDKYLYIVDYWVPFPQSEYGGVINVVAKDDQECFDLCRELDDGYNDVHLNNHQLEILNEFTKKNLCINIEKIERKEILKLLNGELNFKNKNYKPKNLLLNKIKETIIN